MANFEGAKGLLGVWVEAPGVAHSPLRMKSQNAPIQIQTPPMILRVGDMFCPNKCVVFDAFDSGQ